jgi:hypothetical protein
VTYTVRSGPPVTASHHGQQFSVRVEEPVAFPGDYRTHDAALTTVSADSPQPSRR